MGSLQRWELSLGWGYGGGWRGWQSWQPAGPSLGKLQGERAALPAHRAGTRLGDRSPGVMAPMLAACGQPRAPALGRQLQPQQKPCPWEQA